MGNILVVDDERSIRITLKGFLEMAGYAVEIAAEADTAMAILQSQPVDVIVTDIILPRVSGVELLRRIREISTIVQVIMMSGEPTLETASEALRLGAMDYLQKPVGKKEILKAVHNALHVKNLIDEKMRLEEENQRYLQQLEQLVEERTQALAASETALRHRAEELLIINQLARQVNESITVDVVVQCGLQEIVKTAGPDFAVIFLRNGDDLALKGVFPEQEEMGWEPLEAHKAGVCLCGLAVSEGLAIYSPDIHSDPRCSLQECRQAGFRSFAALPLHSGAEIIGVLGMASQQPQDFQEYSTFLEALANEMSTGLKKSLLYEQVQQHALKLEESLARIEEAESERLQLLQHLQRSQKMEAMGTLASGIAHDFNNILAAIIGYAELALMDTPETAQSQKSLEMVLAAGNRAKDLVKQILAFSRQSEEQLKPIRITHTLKEVLSLMRASLPATIEIRENLNAGVGNILADPVQIHQVLLNLCTNAHHAMKEKGGVLEVQLTGVNLGPEGVAIHPDLNPGPYIKLVVKDNGHGMDEVTKAKIFDPYFTTKEKGVGTGLGLAVAHSIVKKHGGAITVDSVPGQGSEFTLHFPTILEDEAWETPISANLPTGQEHILLIDDEQALADMGREMLEYLGYQVDTRMSSIDALALFRDHPQRYDLVITDLTMPNMTGDQLAQELLRIRPDIPIMLCTGYGESILEERAKSIGIKAFIMKPILMAHMARTIREALGK